MAHRRFGRTASILLSVSVPAFGLLPALACAQIGIGVSITLAPPEIPVYAQPEIPGPGYLWTPGYWAWADQDYYWVPGTWVLAPQPGYLWTPGYWGWANGAYLWHGGYWGTHVGYYGGVNYGYGYGGSGYQGGYWAQDHFFYNRSVNNVRGNTRITNVYNRTVINQNSTRISYNGGHGGVSAQPTTDERAAASEAHLNPVREQVQHEQVAHAMPELRAGSNHGRPPIAATAHAGVLAGPDVVPATPRAPMVHAGPMRPNAPQAAPREAPAPREATAQRAAPPAPRPAPARIAERAPDQAPPHANGPRPGAAPRVQEQRPQQQEQHPQQQGRGDNAHDR